MRRHGSRTVFESYLSELKDLQSIVNIQVVPDFSLRLGKLSPLHTRGFSKSCALSRCGMRKIVHTLRGGRLDSGQQSGRSLRSLAAVSMGWKFGSVLKLRSSEVVSNIRKSMLGFQEGWKRRKTGRNTVSPIFQTSMLPTFQSNWGFKTCMLILKLA